MTTITHPHDDRVYVCPDCEHRQDLYQRQDGSIACYNCGAEVPDKLHLHSRSKIRGVSNRVDPPEPEPITEPDWEFSPGLSDADRERLREVVGENLIRGPDGSE